jgi:glycosyltransferase involved in cell wall biosynthesis
VLLGNQKVATSEIIDCIQKSTYRKDIIIPGFAPDDLLPSLYHFSTAFIVPSEYEGFGLPVLESYSYKTPTIVAKNSSLVEVAGDGALYFPTKDSNALCDQMQNLVSNKKVRSEQIKHGTQQLKNFSWQKCAKETLNTYLEVLNS